MGILRTLFRVLAGFTLACLTAAFVQVLYVTTPTGLAGMPAGELADAARNLLVLVLATATHIAIFSFAFALIAAGIAEWLGGRTLGYWLVVGIAIALLGFSAQYSSEVSGQPTILNNYALQSFLTAGFFAGLVYWLVAGARTPAAHVRTGERAIAQARIKVQEELQKVKKGSLAERIALKRERDAKDKDAGTKAAPPHAPREPSAATATTSVPITKPASSQKPAAGTSETPASKS